MQQQQQYLVAVDTSGFERLGVVPAAVHIAVLVEVDEVDEQLHADDADETRRVPAHVASRPTREHRQLALAQWFTALRQTHHHRRGCRSWG